MLRLALALLLGLPQPAPPLTLEIRTFDGTRDVSAEARVTLYRAGDRGQAVARAAAGEGPPVFGVPPGIYDIQTVQEREGRVVNLRWAERLVVMPYPDEGGHHLEVINLRVGFGALQIRSASGDVPARNLSLFRAGDRTQPEPQAPDTTTGYTLFVVPAGTYDLQVVQNERITWHLGIEVPRDRTRFWLVP